MKIRIPPETFVKRRQAIGLNQSELARTIGVCRNAVSQWERGKCAPNWPTHKALCEVLKIDPNTLEALE